MGTLPQNVVINNNTDQKFKANLYSNFDDRWAKEYTNLIIFLFHDFNRIFWYYFYVTTNTDFLKFAELSRLSKGKMTTTNIG